MLAHLLEVLTTMVYLGTGLLVYPGLLSHDCFGHLAGVE
jgi:hypothetical protein